MEAEPTDGAPSTAPSLETYCQHVLHSLRFDGQCAESREYCKTLYPLLVTGLGGSGTSFLAAEFARMGLDIQHERKGQDGIVSWFQAINPWTRTDAHWPSWRGKFRIHRGDCFRQVFHQVRHPLAVIGALTTHKHGSRLYMARACNLSTRAEHIRGIAFTARVWICWNSILDRFADWRYRIEDTSAVEVCLRAGFGARCTTVGATVDPDTQSEPAHIAAMMANGSDGGRVDGQHLVAAANHRKHPRVTWEMLEQANPALAAEVFAMAQRYGYGREIPARRP